MQLTTENFLPITDLKRHNLSKNIFAVQLFKYPLFQFPSQTNKLYALLTEILLIQCGRINNQSDKKINQNQ